MSDDFKTFVEKRPEIEARLVQRREQVVLHNGDVRSVAEGQVIIRNPLLGGSQLEVMFLKDFEKRWERKKGPRAKSAAQETTQIVNQS